MGHALDRHLLLDLLAHVGGQIDTVVEVTLVGGAAGMLTAQLPATRTTLDCDVIRAEPEDCFEGLRNVAEQIARGRGLPEDRLNDRTTCWT